MEIVNCTRNAQRIGYFDVDGELLRKALCLPDGTEIQRIEADFMRPGVFQVRVSHPSLLPIPEAGVIPRYCPVFVRGPEGQTSFGGWGGRD